MARSHEPRDFKNQASANYSEAFEKVYKIFSSTSVKRFKIGKSSEKTEDIKKRYVGQYSKIQFIKRLQSSSLADLLEIELIASFINRAKCDNEKIGGGPSLSGSDWYRIYVVYR